MTMRPFDRDGSCVQCGAEALHVIVASREDGVIAGLDAYDEPGSHYKRRCLKCGHEWPEQLNLQ